jgi:hypothetical protein
MSAVAKISRSDVKLIVFGTPNEDMADEFSTLGESESIRAVGWVDAAKVYDYLLAADLAIFPGTHSVLWEQASVITPKAAIRDHFKTGHMKSSGTAF